MEYQEEFSAEAILGNVITPGKHKLQGSIVKISVKNSRIRFSEEAMLGLGNPKQASISFVKNKMFVFGEIDIEGIKKFTFTGAGRREISSKQATELALKSFKQSSDFSLTLKKHSEIKGTVIFEGILKKKD